jgi:hypothetical protein
MRWAMVAAHYHAPDLKPELNLPAPTLPFLTVSHVTPT